MVITKEEKQNILDFFSACNEMIEGRFLLSDTKVSNILKCVVNSSILYDLYAKCTKGFKFSNVLEASRADNPENGGFFTLIDGDKNIVAFVTCFLLEVDKKNINLQAFIQENFFNTDGYNISYNNFALTVLVAYKNAVKRLLGIDEQANAVDYEGEAEEMALGEEEEKIESDEETKISFANLLMNINELQNIINDDYKIKYSEKEELLIVLKALHRAVQMEELLIINALLVPLEHTLVKNKKCKNTYEQIKILIASIYF
ncbi:MAG: hypothetical protein E7354_02665 [Clostridiales bacterium]|nr:hypothetical protein [Clostridiales bacterium]